VESWLLARLRDWVILPSMRKAVPVNRHVRSDPHTDTPSTYAQAQIHACLHTQRRCCTACTRAHATVPPSRGVHTLLMLLGRRSTRPLQRFFVSVAADGAPVRRALRMDNALLGHVVLVDRDGRVRWQAHGFAAPGEAERLVALTHRLLRAGT
jgi:hypothetical protein